MDHDFFDEEMNITDNFKDQLPALVGDSYKDADGNATKVFDSHTTLPAILKDLVDVHRAYGKKQDNVIQKPGENPSDDDKSNYIKTLAAELGLSKSVEDLKFEHGDIPEGMKIKEAMEAEFKKLVVDGNIPTRYANQVMKWFNGFQAAEFAADKETKLKEFTEASDKYETDFLGDKGIENGRIAFNAISKFNRDDAEMIKMMNESGVYDDPSNLGLWKSIGIMPSDLRSWGLIGEEMGVSSSPSGDVHKPGGDNDLQEAANEMFPNTPDEYNKV